MAFRCGSAISSRCEGSEKALDWDGELEALHDPPPTTLTIEGSEVLEERPDDPMGVYWVSAFHLYREDDD